MKKIFVLLIAVCLVLCLAVGLSACENGESCEEVGHDLNFTGEIIEGPTCTEAGLGIGLCMRCHEAFEMELPATGHKEHTTPGQAATCTSDGFTDKVECTVCYEVISPAEVIPGGHVRGEIREMRVPTFRSTGRVIYKCQRCTYNAANIELPSLRDEKYTVEFAGEVDKYTYTTEDGITIKFDSNPFNFSEYTVWENGKSVQIGWYVSGCNTKRSNLVIPSTYKDLPVLGIGSYAFSNTNALNTHDATIESVVIPEGVIEISREAFKNCTTMTSITLPSTLQEIYGNAFENCTSLKEITVPENVIYISGRAFQGCTALESVKILGNTSVQYNAFSGCTSLKSVTMENGGNLFYGAFENCTALTSVTLSDTLEYIGENAFIGCTALEYNVSGAGKYLGSKTNPYLALMDFADDGADTFTVANGARHICAPIGLWNAYETVSIPNSISTIFMYTRPEHDVTVDYGGGANDWVKIYFVEDRNQFLLDNAVVKFSDGTTSKTVTDIVFADGMTKIQYDALRGFDAVTTVTVPKSATGLCSFPDSLETFYYKGSVEDWCKISFNIYFNNSKCYSSNNPMNTADNFYILNENNEFVRPTKVVIPESITELKPGAFINAKDMTFVLHSGITNVSNHTFAGAENVHIFWAGEAETIDAWEIEKYSTALETYYYQEDQQSLSEYLGGDRKWHYDENGNPVAWFIETNTLKGKTYTYTDTVVIVSDEYWAALMQAKQLGILEDLLDGDQIMIEMINSSSNKDEYTAKLKEFSKKVGTNITATFADGMMTLSQSGTASVAYREINGCVYVANQVFFYISDGAESIYEDNSNQFIVIQHVWTLSE